MGISGGGQTSYEFAHSGIPLVAVTMADNQHLNVSGLAACGVAVAAGSPKDEGFARSLRQALGYLRDGRRPRRMSDRGHRLLDGQGALRVAGNLLARRPA
jgi:spore coat polysaccharide biosynthesis predicted glycosyltransferase SpsG